MQIVLLPLSVPLIAFLIHFLYERVVSPFYPPRSRQRVVLWIGLFASLLTTLLGLFMEPGLDFPWLFLNLIYLFAASLGFSHFYFHIFNLSESARRIHILMSCVAGEKNEGGYEPETIIEQRLERLVAIGALRLEQGRFYAKTGFPLFVAKCVAGLRRIF